MEIAQINTRIIPAGVKHGIAPTMMADATKPCCGGENENIDQLDNETNTILGCQEESKMKEVVRQFTKRAANNDFSAREVIQAMTKSERMRGPVVAGKIEQVVMVDEPSAYSDGSVKNPRGMHWKMGGVGLWWRGRNLTDTPLTMAELI